MGKQKGVTAAGVCTVIKSKPRRPRRSLSTSSIDVKGSVVREKVWMFEGMKENFDGHMADQLSDVDTDRNENRCNNHIWVMYTNLMYSQLCAKCNKRIFPHRISYKCSACARLCHIKCAFKTDSTTLESKMNMRDYTSPPDPMYAVPYTKQGQKRVPFSPLQDNQIIGGDNRHYMDTMAPHHNIDTMATHHNMDYMTTHDNIPVDTIATHHNIDTMATYQNIDTMELHVKDDDRYMEDINNNQEDLEGNEMQTGPHTKGKQSHARQRLTNMRQGFVKGCKSIKKKVKNLKEKVNMTDDKKVSNKQLEGQDEMDTPDSMGDEEGKTAWVRSPVRTRMRSRQMQQQPSIDIAEEHIAAQIHSSLSNRPHTESIRRRIDSYKKPSRNRRYHAYDRDIDSLRRRLTDVEVKVRQLEEFVPREVEKWHTLTQATEAQGVRVSSSVESGELNHGMDETHLKHLEAQIIPNSSSGTASDDVYVVPIDNSSSSNGNNDHLMNKIDHMEHESVPVTQSMKDDSLLPSGIPNRLKLNIISDQSDSIYSNHQTSTPVTNREMSFRSASRQYEQTHKIKHTNVTTISVESSPPKSFQANGDSSDSKNKDEQRRSSNAARETTLKKILSPEQKGVEKFLKCRTDPSSVYNQSRSGSRHSSPSVSFTEEMERPFIQSNVYASPIASSTFRNGNGMNSAEMSPLSFTLRNDLGDNSQVSFSKVLSDDYKSEEARMGGADRNNSSNLSYTFRNDSQMIPTNAEEDLPGYTRNQITNRYASSTTEEEDDRRNEESDNQYGHRIQVEADIEMDHPREPVNMMRQESVCMTATDGLSLTNVTQLSGEAINSFSEDQHHRSRWANKDVFMFGHDKNSIRTRAPRGKPKRSKSQSPKSKYQTTVDETGDGRKPPIPAKRSISSSNFDYLIEAERCLEVYKNRHSQDAGDNLGVSLQRLPRPSVLKDLDTDSTDDIYEEKVMQTHVRGQKSMPKLKSPAKLPRDNTTREFVEFENQLQETDSDSDSSANYCEVKEEKMVQTVIGDQQTMAKVSDKLGEMENKLNKEAAARSKKYSRSLSSLQKTESEVLVHSHKTYGRTVSCTSSIDGTYVNESAKYHFLHEKGMVKISSPSLKIVPNSPALRHEQQLYSVIDEASTDLAETESDSEISGMFAIDNKFRINGNRGTTSSVGTTASQPITSEAAGTVETMSQSSRSEGEVSREQMQAAMFEQCSPAQMQAEMFEHCLKTAEDNEETWDNVLHWMKEYSNPEDDAELEEEFEQLMKQQEAEQTSHTPTQRSPKHSPHSHSPLDDSVYYSFQGQSEDLRSLLSPRRQNSSARLEDDVSLGPGLIHVIQNGGVQDVAKFLNSDRTISEIEIKEAVSWALEDKNLDITLLLLEDICRLIKAAEEDNCVDVYPAYRENHQWEPVFVILSRHSFQGEWDSFMGFHVYRRRYDFVSAEAALVLNTDLVRNNPLSVEDERRVRKAINSQDLKRRHSKITVINACPCRSTKEGQVLEKQTCIVIHCLLKGFIPFAEDPFPREIEGVPVDVREAYFSLGVGTPPRSCASHPWDDEVSNSDETGSQLSLSAGDSSACMTGSQSSGSRRSLDFSDRDKNLHLGTSLDVDLDGDILMGKPLGPQGDNAEGAPATDKIVEKMQGMDIDLHFGTKNNEVNRHLLMGSCIGPSGHEGSGTLGGFVHLPDGGVGFLTCAHVVGDVGAMMSQPADAELQTDSEAVRSKTVCGSVTKVIFQQGSCDSTGVDAAIVKLSQRFPVDGQFIWCRKEQLKFAGFDPHSPPTFSSGKILKSEEITPKKRFINVLKFGATTGLTRGSMYLNGSYVREFNREIRINDELGSLVEFFNQLEVLSMLETSTRFFDLGDSGALVFMPLNGSDLHCIGLAIGCTSYGSCIITPIENVLERLGLLLEFVNFAQ